MGTDWFLVKSGDIRTEKLKTAWPPSFCSEGGQISHVIARSRTWLLILIFVLIINKAVLNRCWCCAFNVPWERFATFINSISWDWWISDASVNQTLIVVWTWADCVGGCIRTWNAYSLGSAVAPVNCWFGVHLWVIIVKVKEIRPRSNLARIIYKSTHFTNILTVISLIALHINNRGQKPWGYTGHRHLLQTWIALSGSCSTRGDSCHHRCWINDCPTHFFWQWWRPKTRGVLVVMAWTGMVLFFHICLQGRHLAADVRVVLKHLV